MGQGLHGILGCFVEGENGCKVHGCGISVGKGSVKVGDFGEN